MAKPARTRPALGPGAQRADHGAGLQLLPVLPHFPVGVSEVHFILGSTLFLLFGAAPAAIGLALGLLIQGCSSRPSICRNTA